MVSDERSGSTLLDMLLSSSDDAVSVGEMRLLSNHINREGFGYTWDWKCTCEKSINECGFWSSVIRQYDIQHPGSEIETAVEIKLGFKELIKAIFLSYIGRLSQYYDKNNKNYIIAEKCWSIYNAIYDLTGKLNIVDSSKKSEQLYYLAKTSPGIKIKSIHIVRDSRGVANSKLKWENSIGKRVRFSLCKGLFAWFFVNLKIKKTLEHLHNVDSLRINYEELCEKPAEVMTKICDFLGIKYSENMLVMDVVGKHNIAGTPNRFGKRNEAISKDEKWKGNINYKRNIFINYLGRVLNKAI